MVAVTDVDVHAFLNFKTLTYYLEDAGAGISDCTVMLNSTGKVHTISNLRKRRNFEIQNPLGFVLRTFKI